jgi:hypothetical protein
MHDQGRPEDMGTAEDAEGDHEHSSETDGEEW